MRGCKTKVYTKEFSFHDRQNTCFNFKLKQADILMIKSHCFTMNYHFPFLTDSMSGLEKKVRNDKHKSNSQKIIQVVTLSSTSEEMHISMVTV